MYVYIYMREVSTKAIGDNNLWSWNYRQMWAALYGCQEPNSRPLQGQYILLTSESSVPTTNAFLQSCLGLQFLLRLQKLPPPKTQWWVIEFKVMVKIESQIYKEKGFLSWKVLSWFLSLSRDMWYLAARKVCKNLLKEQWHHQLDPKEKNFQLFLFIFYFSFPIVFMMLLTKTTCM